MKKKRDDEPTIREQPVTYDDYAAMPDDGNRYEIIDGVLELMSPGPMTIHQAVSRELEFLFMTSCRSEYEIFSAPLDVILSKTNVVQPDLLMIHISRLETVKPHGIEGAPDLAVEILSRGTRKRDKVVKAAVYARHQVPEYWLVDPETRTLERYRLAGDRYELAELYAEDDRVSSDKLPCISFTLRDIFDNIRIIGSRLA
ncbi:Uma2 family endonuclease [Paenibacillaceae bacterium WGS1546]|uniref:Uma2 family endonuclease n=1 Tax=Cohnella sp. WGS1546 TaxID=3366810 RepID=UPI00372D13FD